MKKIFYNKRHKLPIWSQIYVVWLILFCISIFWVGKYEIIENKNLIRNAYDYKDFQNSINTSYNSIKNKYPANQSENKILTLKNFMQVLNWNVKETNYNINQSRCSVVTIVPKGHKIQLGLLFDSKIDDVHLKISHTLAAALDNEKSRDTAIALIEGSPVCNDFVIQNNLLKIENYGGYILAFPSEKTKSSLHTSFLYGFSSIGWSGIIPISESRPGIIDQVSNMVIPYFERTFVQNNGDNFNLIGWSFPEEIFKNELENVNFVLPGILFSAKNYSSIKDYKNHIWIGTDKAISRGGIRILAFIIILLIWMPVANRLYQKENFRNLFASFFSTFFNSILLFLLVATSKIFSYFFPDSYTGPLLVTVVGLVLYVVFYQMQKKTLNVSASYLAEYLIMVIFASLLAVVNFLFLLSLLPLIFIANIKPKLPGGVFKFLLLAFSAPFIFYLVYLIKSNGISPSVSLLVLDKVFFTHSLQTLLVVFTGGSLISICRDAR